MTDLAASSEFYVDVLGLHVSGEDDEVIYLRSTEEFIHHNLVLRKGLIAAVAAAPSRALGGGPTGPSRSTRSRHAERRPEGFASLESATPSALATRPA